MKNTKFTTEHAVYCLNKPRKKFQNDMTRGLLPIPEGPGTGKARLYSFNELVRLALYYQLVDCLGVTPRNASELANKMVDENMTFESTVTLYVIYKDSEENYCSVLSPGKEIFEDLTKGFYVSQPNGWFDYKSAISLIHVDSVLEELKKRWDEVCFLTHKPTSRDFQLSRGAPTSYVKRMVDLNKS